LATQVKLLQKSAPKTSAKSDASKTTKTAVEWVFIKMGFHRNRFSSNLHRPGGFSLNLHKRASLSKILSHHTLIFDESPPSGFSPNVHRGWVFIEPSQVVLFTESTMKHVELTPDIW
jgi:hypothetical protein